jgi:DNA (cytosine-5)-methyltransferase 1
VNHDAKAIESHRANHPDCIHYIEDIRDFEVVVKLKKQVDLLRIQHPDCIVIIWASLECTNYSKAKGGQPRDADSRTLAEHLFMYLEHLTPEYLMIENVREFMSWGPLDEKGRPVCRMKGKDYLKWVDNVKSFGFDYDWRLLNAADFGSYQSRERYFGQFARKGYPIAWPEPTHSKNPTKQNTLFGDPLKKWKPVRDVLDLEDVGQSIFNRKKPLVEATLKRIYAGLIKFVAGGEDKWLIKYNSMSKRGTYNPPSLNDPSPVVSTQGRLGVVFATSYYGNGGSHDTNEPCPT